MLRLETVSKNFGGLWAVSEVSLEVQPGQIFSLIGPNGSGKTTLFNLITGLLPVSGGKIYFQGNDITGFPAHKRSPLGLGRTFQITKLFQSCNAIENVIISMYCQTRAGLLATVLCLSSERKERAKTRAKAEDLLDLVGLHDKKYVMSAQLSFADQRRLEIARALALNPNLLLLDEPTPGMTAHEIKQLKDLILKLRDKGVTMFLIEHNMKLVMDISDWVAVMNFGRKLVEGKPRDVAVNPEVVKAYLGSE
jgi:branched-chain amino acid transport system ATP-binding protein